jgi:hypothetical protein
MSDQEKDQRQTCSVNGKLCINGIRSDFENDPIICRPRLCNKWIKLIGKDPQTEKHIEEFCCNEWGKIKIGLENCQMLRFNTASLDKVANETHELTDNISLAIDIRRKKQLE